MSIDKSRQEHLKTWSETQFVESDTCELSQSGLQHSCNNVGDSILLQAFLAPVKIWQTGHSALCRLQWLVRTILASVRATRRCKTWQGSFVDRTNRPENVDEQESRGTCKMMSPWISQEHARAASRLSTGGLACGGWAKDRKAGHQWMGVQGKKKCKAFLDTPETHGWRKEEIESIENDRDKWMDGWMDTWYLEIGTRGPGQNRDAKASQAPKIHA